MFLTLPVTIIYLLGAFCKSAQFINRAAHFINSQIAQQFINCVITFVSLREAARIQKEIKCNCCKGCKSNQCTCRSSGFKCSTHCHPTSSICCNKQLEDNIKENGMKRTRNVDENDVKEEYVKRAKVLLLLLLYVFNDFC